MRALLLAAVMALSPLATAPALAVQPDEILSDPALEARARALSKGLRCLVCQNENIDDSNATLARDLRIVLRERLVAGDTDAQAIQYLVDRYGEFVLLNPRATGSTLALWLAGPAMLLAGGGIAWAAVRRRAAATPSEDLSESEQRRLAELLKD